MCLLLIVDGGGGLLSDAWLGRSHGPDPLPFRTRQPSPSSRGPHLLAQALPLPLERGGFAGTTTTTIGLNWDL